MWISGRSLSAICVSGGLLSLAACSNSSKEEVAVNCAPTTLSQSGAATGAARVFLPDPLVSSGNAQLSPTASNLNEFADPVTLRNLSGLGVLASKYVDVRDGDVCGSGYGAYSAENAFSYPLSDPRFREAMTYYWGDRYRERLDQAGYLDSPSRALTIFANCRAQENAFYFRGQANDGSKIERVCLGYSGATPGARYADDAMVTIHEMQHATTTNLYDPSGTGQLNQFWYDEAGSLNEAVSDFMAMLHPHSVIEELAPSFDSRVFSRWALGTFIPRHSGARGAHRCPAYDPSFPACASFPAFSAANNTISYVYPDGMGWPYANNFQGPGYAASAFAESRAQEEIHNAGVLLTGALWDAYEAVRVNHPADDAEAQRLMTRVTLEAIKHLPQRSSSNRSPVTFRGLASQMSLYAASVGMNAADQASLDGALTARGLLGGAQVSAGWADVHLDPASVTPGLQIQDNPSLLKEWLMSIFSSANAAFLVPQGIDTGLNGRMDPGELVAVWFDLLNKDVTTAGGVRLTITALDPQVQFEKEANGDSWLSASQAQIMYGKVNGSGIVQSLNAPNPTYKVATGNSYFRTNPWFSRSWTTAVWVRVNGNAAHGTTARFQVEAQPTNGAASTTTFTATIN